MIANLNLAVLPKLMSLGKLTTNEISPDHGRMLLSAFGYEASDDLVNTIVTLIKSEDEQPILDYVFNADNIEKLKIQVSKNAEAQTFLVACPRCAGLTVKPVMAVAKIDPHVVCVHCAHKIDLED
jgi:hypothetical protein